MSFDSERLQTHWIEFEASTYNEFNEWPSESHNQTFCEMAQDEPGDAYNLLCQYIIGNSLTNIKFTIETATGAISTEQDLDSARMAFLQTAKRILVGSLVTEPIEINITSVIPLADICSNGRKPTGEWLDGPGFTIFIEPPSFAV